MTRCSTCPAEVSGFRDALSAREFQISGTCQKCQDAVFCDLYTGAATCNKPCCADDDADDEEA